MGFMDKVKGAVSTAKDELDKSGVLDQFKASNASPPIVEHDTTQDLIDSIRRGAVDPSRLLSQAEVEAIAGHPVGPALLTFNGDFVCASFDSEKPRERYSLHSYHNIDDTVPWDADEQWAFLKDHVDVVDPIDDLGDDAYRDHDHVFVLASNRVLWATVTGDRLSVDAGAIRAEAMMRRAVKNLAALG